MTLQEKLDAHKKEFEKNLPPEKLAIMHHATQELRRSGMVDRVLKVGATAPDFTLPNATGGKVSSAELRKSGPLVVTFYRGVW